MAKHEINPSHILDLVLTWADDRAGEPLRSELLSIACPSLSLWEPVPISKEKAKEIITEVCEMSVTLKLAEARAVITAQYFANEASLYRWQACRQLLLDLGEQKPEQWIGTAPAAVA